MERPTSQRSTPGRRAFTLVEMLVVIFILAIVIGLVVGVSGYLTKDNWKKQTISTQKVLEAAILEYYKAKNAYPNEQVPLSGTQLAHSQNLYSQLMTVPKAADIVRTLPSGAIGSNMAAVPPVYWFVDGKGLYMDYLSTGGRAGAPVVISAGEDGQFGTADDIRSTDN